MQALEEAFGEVMGAIDDLSRYRREALPQLDAQIDRLAALARRGDEAIDRLQRGSEAHATPLEANVRPADDTPRGG